MAPCELGYWSIRGLAQPIRFLLEYTETEFVDKMFECGPAPNFDRSCWTDVKRSLGLDFPNLPYFIDGEVRLTQSNAIMRYIARKHDLCGKSEEEKVAVDLVLEVAMDFRNGFVRLCYNQDFENLKDGYIKDLAATLSDMEKFLGAKQWFAGSLTFVDFIMYELLYQHRALVPDLMANYPNITAFIERFEKLPKIKGYLQSPRFMNVPFNNKMAKFGNVVIV